MVQLRPMAQEIAKAVGKPVKIVLFEGRVDVEVISPEVGDKAREAGSQEAQAGQPTPPRVLIPDIGGGNWAGCIRVRPIGDFGGVYRNPPIRPLQVEAPESSQEPQDSQGPQGLQGQGVEPSNA